MDPYQRRQRQQLREDFNTPNDSICTTRVGKETGFPRRQQQPIPENSRGAFREPRVAPRPPNAQPSRQGFPMSGPRQTTGGLSPDQSYAESFTSSTSPRSQWPLQEENADGSPWQEQDLSNPQYQSSRNNGPQRPPRTRQPAQSSQQRFSRDPAIVQQQQQQQQYDQYHRQMAMYNGLTPHNQSLGRNEEHMESPTSTMDITTSSVSSAGDIPDFPLPIQKSTLSVPPRRSLNIGPPPVARRGASSFYSNISNVSPIPEESDRSRSHGSYASSCAIPSNWGDESPGYRSHGSESPQIVDDTVDEGRESRESHYDDNEEQGLVRSASLGKRGKPQLVMTRSSSGEKTDQLQKAQLASTNEETKTAQEIATAMLGASIPRSDVRNKDVQMLDARPTSWPILTDGNYESPLAGGTGLLEDSSSDNNSSGAKAMNVNEAPASTPKATDRRTSSFLPVDSADVGLARADSDIHGFSKPFAIRKPLRIDMDAVRDAEARGSLTSLSDLIKRATRLAALIDVGKRPGSRMVDLSTFDSIDDLGHAKPGVSEKRPASGLSGMLAAFPNPVSKGEKLRRDSVWPSPGSDDGHRTPENGPRKRRRCCGLPSWGFLILFLVIAIVVAAGIAVPLKLLVFNKKPASGLSACQASTTCANGGTVSIVSETCSCLCTNGFTGSSCTIAGSDGCSTINMNFSSGSLSNATVGTAIPRLVSQAQSNFSIALSAEKILARFNAANLSCTLENTLVTFDGLASSTGDSQAMVSASMTSSASPSNTAAARIKRLADASDIASGSMITPPAAITAAATSAYVNPSITLDTSSFKMSQTSLPPAPTVPGTLTTSSQSSASTNIGSFEVTSEVLDFARVVTLLILQEKSFDAAVSAQTAIQAFIGGSSEVLTSAKASNLTIGDGESVNFYLFNVDLGMGLIGGAATRRKRGFLDEKRVEGRQGFMLE